MKKISLLFAILFFSCTPEDGVDGRDGINGQDGVDGQDGFSIGLVSTDLGNGCRELNFFRDSNNNGVQESNESSITIFEVCDGISPNIKMISQDDENCSNGGKIFTFFNDLDDDGELDSNEDVLGSDSVCNGVDGIDGNAGSGYALFIEQATTSECANGGFKVSVFVDLNSNAEYDSQSESITNSTVICFPDKDSIDFPDYSELGHTMGAIGVWRLYSVQGVPVEENYRFNLKIYPDPLNPNLLVTDKNNQSGLLDFGANEKIGWTYNYSNQAGYTTKLGMLRFDESLIEGISENLNTEMIHYPSTDEDQEYIYVNYDRGVSVEFFPKGLRQARFYRIQ